jgi:hypothetical protein
MPFAGDNSPAVTLARDRHISTLWNLTFNEHRVRCAIYHAANGMELRLESATGVILTEPFDMEPRSLARTRALRESLKRRGWKENPKFQDPSSKSQ